ncbi:hypothetical protein LCGC14_1893260, partial [marine sediment metagenome]
MAVLQFTIKVNDDGTAVVEKFTKGVGDSAKKAGKSADKMTTAFAGVRKGLGGVSKAVFSLRGLLIGLGATAIIRSVTRAAFAQEEAVARVNASLRASGQFSEEASQALQDFASQMQATTIFGDEVILNQIALAQAFGFTTENVQEAVEAAVELSAAAGIELTEAIRRVGRTISGSTADVQKFAPEIANLTKQQLAAGDAAKVLGDALRGSAAAQAETARGRFIQLSNALGDVVERIGLSITSSDKFRDAIEGVATGLNNANSAAAGTGGLGDALAELVPGVETTTRIIQFFSEAIIANVIGVKSLRLAILSALAPVATFGNAIDLAASEALGFNDAAKAAVERQIELSDELAKSSKEIDRLFKLLGRLTLAHEDAAKAAQKQTEAQSELARVTAKITAEVKAQIQETSVGFQNFLAILDAPSAAIVKATNELLIHVDRIPKAFKTSRQEIDALFGALPEFTAEQNALVSAELDKLIARFGQLPTEIGNPLQAVSLRFQDFLGLTRLTAEEATTAINGIVSAFSTGFAFSTSEAANQFGQLSSQFQAGFGKLNALTAKAASFETQINADKAATIIGITSSLFGSLSALAGEGSRSQFEG